MLQFLTQSTWADRIGWVLVHSLWQFALVALLVAMLQWALRRRSAATRYGVLLAAMSIAVALPAVTWFLLPPADVPAAATELAPAAAESFSPLPLREERHDAIAGNAQRRPRSAPE